MPNQTATKQSETLNKIFNKPKIKSPFSNKAKVSKENAEKVVNPPKKPTNNSARKCGAKPLKRSSKNTLKNPIASEPMMLTVSVPKGNNLPMREYTPVDTKYRKTEPTAPPMAIKNN